MAFDEGLAERIRGLIDGEPEMSERRMFGGLCFMYGGNMCFGIVGEELMVRVGRDAHEGALTLPHVREMDFTGRPSKGMVYIGVEGISEDRDLEGWLRRGLDVAHSLPAK